MRKILVIANETVGGEALLDALPYDAEVRLVVPTPRSPAAELRASRAVARLAACGIPASGHVGNADPLLAIEDELRTFAADEIVISTHPPGRSRWLARDLVDRACERFDLPIVHVVARARRRLAAA